jgi:hypothetical protein
MSNVSMHSASFPREAVACEYYNLARVIRNVIDIVKNDP